MPDINRRRFLQLAGASAAFAAMTNSIERAAAIPAHRRFGDIKDVEHIVVLMQENRSFDHYFGTLQRRPRLRRPAAGDACRAASRSGTSRTRAARRSCPSGPEADDLGLQFIQDLDARLGRTATRRIQQRQVRPVDPGQDARPRWRT